ncbi:MAG: hypothetical protein J0M04_09640 [Verrucomicrobia bacterium]|nr:hypothetical protein [Verrucomicrobiota bacterium]
MNTEDEELIKKFQDSLTAITTSLQLNTRHPKDTIESWKKRYQDKMVKIENGEDLGVAKIHLDPADHVFVSVGGSTFPVGHLQALVDAGSLSVVDS